ncbi:dirigent protein 21-like [Typha angustifolia]|uniref:dirigent protein 21-like n=1 Tax=Typha angustifolia TaxID=59011 RepID=UPI003C309BA3
MYVIDDLLTDGPSPTSAVVGRAQGFYMFASLKDSALLVNMNVVLTEGKYNGSTLAILGRDPILSLVRELSVVGGSGRFRMARGYVLWKTYFFNITSGDAVLELDVYAMQVKRCSVSS